MDQLQSPDEQPTLAAEPDVEAERQARLAYYRSVNKPAKKHRGLQLTAIVMLVLVVGGGISGAAYWHFSNNTPTVQSNPIAVHQAQSQAESTANQKVPTKGYDSTNFAVNINYPETWTVLDNSTDLAITSPVTQITDPSGSIVSGKIIMNMVPKGTLPTLFGTEATAVLDSIKVNYTQPTQSQRASTYLSFAQYQATTTSGSLDAIFVTGNYGYKKDQNIPSTDLINVDPLISVSFEKCADTVCTAGLTPLSIKATDWQSSTLSAPITTLLTSLAFQ